MRFNPEKALRALIVCLPLALAAQPPAASAQAGARPGQPAPAAAAEQGQAAAGRREEGERLTFMPDARQDARAEAPGASATLARTLGALLIVVGLVVAAGWGLRRFGGARFGSPRDDAPELRVLNSVALGDKRSLVVVRFAGRELLVGSTAQSLTVLSSGAGEGARAYAPRSVAELLGSSADDEPQGASGLADGFESELSQALASAGVPRPASSGGEA